MSDQDDLDGVTPRLSDADFERLLSGAPPMDDSQRLADLDKVMNALRTPPEPSEFTGLDSALAAFSGTVVATQIDSMGRVQPMKKRLLTGKALAGVAAITFASAGVAAAAGVVPTPFSASRPSIAAPTKHDDDDATDEATVEATDAADTSLYTSADIDETEPSDVTEEIATNGTSSVSVEVEAANGQDQGPDVNGPAKFGLCTAFAARTKHDDTTTTAAATPPAEPVADGSASDLPIPFQALKDAADAAGQSVTDFCADAVPGGSGDSSGHSADNPSATAPGKAGQNPSATAPGKSDNPSATAHGKPADNPSTTAAADPADNPSATAHGVPAGTPGGSHGHHGPPSSHP